jgi:hypothetical protein
MRKTLSHNLLLAELATQLRFPVGQVRQMHTRFASVRCSKQRQEHTRMRRALPSCSPMSRSVWSPSSTESTCSARSTAMSTLLEQQCARRCTCPSCKLGSYRLF